MNFGEENDEWVSPQPWRIRPASGIGYDLRLGTKLDDILNFKAKQLKNILQKGILESIQIWSEHESHFFQKLTCKTQGLLVMRQLGTFCTDMVVLHGCTFVRRKCGLFV